jgi:hypothetical protein
MCKAKIRLGEARSIFLATSTNGMLFVFFYKKKNMDNPQLAGQVLGLALSLFFFLY